MKNILIIRDNLLKTDRNMKAGFRSFIIHILLFTTKIFQYCVYCVSMYVDYICIHRIVSYTGFMECK